MNWAKRIFLFIAINLLVMLTITLTMTIISRAGLLPHLMYGGMDYASLLVMCACFGFAGAIISLLTSRIAAKWAYGIELIDMQRPQGAAEELLAATVRDLCNRVGITTMPQVGIYPSREVNAFATGPSKSRALVAVSSGLLETMDRQGLEGVLGHEISHVVNGDMVTMTLLQGIVNTFVMFLAYAGAFAIENALRGRDSERRGGGLGYFGRYMLINVLETVLMLFAAPLLYAFSRWREYRADRGSAKLYGAPTMIHALESLMGYRNAVDKQHPAFAAFKINGGGQGLLARLFASHPPLEKRIEALKRLG
ncbi:MAG: protease HtpX [Elusimicrobia bacterium]|nr:protease HtpX [Elusimicrobiota bacterium]